MAFHGSVYFFLLFDAKLKHKNVDLGKEFIRLFKRGYKLK
jgi:hypothetical protein